MSETLTETTTDVVVDTPVVDAPVVETAPTPAPPAWEDPAFLDLVDTRAAALMQQQFAPLIPLLEQVLAGDNGATTTTPGPLDPFSDSFAGDLDARFTAIQQMLEQGLERLAAPLQAREQQETIVQGEERLKDILADDIARNGEFSSKPEVDAQARALVRTIADQVFPAIAERFGATPRAAEMAMTHAASSVRDLLAAERSAGAEAETNRLSTLAGLNGEPGVGPTGLTTATSGKPLTTRELVQKFGGRAAALRGAAAG